MYLEIIVQCTYISINELNAVPMSTRKDTPMFEVLKSRYASWKRYNRTVSELESLSSRELDDLGIARGDIASVARAAVRK